MSYPTRDEVRAIPMAAADVPFNDGVSEAFLDHTADETLLVLSTHQSRHPARPSAALDPLFGDTVATR